MLNTYLLEHNLSLIDIESDGYCVVRAWTTGMFLLPNGNNDWQFHDLLNAACQAVIDVPILYDVPVTYQDELRHYLESADYMSDTLDILPQALANVTKHEANIHQIDEKGIITTVLVSPVFARPEGTINLVYHRYRHHYDAAVVGEYY